MLEHDEFVDQKCQSRVLRQAIIAPQRQLAEQLHDEASRLTIDVAGDEQKTRDLSDRMAAASANRTKLQQLDESKKKELEEKRDFMTKAPEMIKKLEAERLQVDRQEDGGRRRRNDR